MMSTQEIAIRLADLVGQGKFEAAQRELFAEDAVSIEAHATEQFARETAGLSAILEKGNKWRSMVERVYSCSASVPLVAGNTIAIALAMDLTMKGRGRMQLAEVCVYAVKNGKIASEQFFM
ncbi:MAG TPA: nuclear transport factor 2 family protein [Steroidobacteraceae bacterium]|nr:nuclear transport factor 2 family protein [Steroidobacteraceae bacterium]